MPSPLVVFWGKKGLGQVYRPWCQGLALTFSTLLSFCDGTPNNIYSCCKSGGESTYDTPVLHDFISKRENQFTVHPHTSTLGVYIQIEEEVTFHRNNPLARQIPNFQVKVVYSTWLCLKTQHISTSGFKSYIRAQPSKSPASLGGEAGVFLLLCLSLPLHPGRPPHSPNLGPLPGCSLYPVCSSPGHGWAHSPTSSSQATDYRSLHSWSLSLSFLSKKKTQEWQQSVFWVKRKLSFLFIF